MEENELDLKALVSTLRRRWRMIAVTFAVVVGVALITTFALTPRFTATAQIYVDVAGRDLLDPSVDASSASTASSKVDSEVEIAKSQKVLLDVVSSLSLVNDEEFGVKLGMTDRLMTWIGVARTELPSGTEALNQVMDKLAGAVSVRRLGLTFLIEISATSADPEKSAQIANAVASAYISSQVSAKVENTLMARDVLKGRLNSASNEVASAEQSFDDYISNNIDALARDAGRADIALLRDELGDAIREREQQSALAEQIQQSIGSSDWTSLADSLQDQALAELASQRDELVGQLEQAESGSQQQIDLRAELDRLNTEIVGYSQTRLKTIRQDVITSEQSATTLRQQLRSSVLASDLPSTVLTQIYGLQQDAEIARQQYQTLLGRVRDLDAQSDVQVADSRLVSQALSPSSPSFPNSRLILILAGIAGLGLGIGLAFLWENYVGGFTTDAQVEGLLHLEVAAVIPMHPLTLKNIEKGEIRSPADLMYLAPMSTYAEAIRRLRANIDIALNQLDFKGDDKATKGRTILVTSAVPREGKSSTALSLARAYALAGHKTLLIDCDLRKPSVHTYLGIEPQGGLVEYIRDGGDSEGLLQAIGQDSHSPLSAIVSGRSSKIPTDQIVSSPLLAELIEKARSIFDVVVLDSPPLVPVVDGVYLAHYADCIALVVQWGATTQSIVRQAVQTLRLGAKPNTPTLTVLNQQQGARDRYANKYYYYYGHEN
ncbi:MAG: hypothetical protein KKH72_09850 [Alphaproteobacteria bacterium]|nr:hypothetical protein [Alphaproteobacteria bacterium]